MKFISNAGEERGGRSVARRDAEGVPVPIPPRALQPLMVLYGLLIFHSRSIQQRPHFNGTITSVTIRDKELIMSL